MKKALVVLLILAVAGGLFAQTVSWSGEVDTGLRIDFKDDSPVTGDDDDGHALKAKLTAVYDADDWGLKIGGTALNTAGLDLNIGNAYGWFNFANNLINLKAGLIDDGVWGNGGEDDEGLATGPGVRVEIKPIAGLNFGAFFTWPDTPDKVSAGKIGNWFQQTAFGVSYDGGVFTAATALRLYSEEDSFTIDDKTDAKWIFGAGFTGVPGFKFYVDGHIWHLFKMSDAGVEQLWEEVTFTGIDKLTLGLKLGEGFVQSFEFARFDVKAFVEFGLTDNVSIGADGNFYMAKNYDDDLAFAGWGFDAWAKYTIGGAWVKGVFGVDGLTEDFGDDTSPYLRILFGFSF